MRLTCLKCGHQTDLAGVDGALRVSCVCGQDYTAPNVINTGTCPSEAAAERSRSRAFRAAGLVKNVGGFALGISLLSIICFPLGIVGAAIGVYCLTMLRGPVGRYSGRRAALAAVGVGVTTFVGEGALALHFLQERRLQQQQTLQRSAPDDLRALLRSQRLFRASSDTYGTFKEFRFEPRYGKYTLYLGPEEYVAAKRDEQQVVDPLPEGMRPYVTESRFLAVSVANIDDDPECDTWALNDAGDVVHVYDDINNVQLIEASAFSEPPPAEAPSVAPSPEGAAPTPKRSAPEPPTAPAGPGAGEENDAAADGAPDAAVPPAPVTPAPTPPSLPELEEDGAP